MAVYQGNGSVPDLQNCTVGIMQQGGIIGTGFFINKEGDVLTCFHVIRNIAAEQSGLPQVTIKFKNSEYQVEKISNSPQPEMLDFAILHLKNKTLPHTAKLIPLGVANQTTVSHNYLSYGFRSDHLMDGAAAAAGKITGVRDYLGIKVLQLNSESPMNQQMRQGMSGAPIYDETTQEIVGMFMEFSNEPPHEIIPIALSLETISAEWGPLQEILDGQDLWQQLVKSEILTINGKWLTLDAFEDLYSGFAGLSPINELQDKVKGLLLQIQGRGQTSEFISYLKERQPGIPVDIHKRRDVRFLNREDEKQMACESLAPPYIFFEGPMGYGKTRFLEEVRKEHFRKRWLCIHLDANEEISSIFDLTKQIYSQISTGTSPAISDVSLDLLAARLGGRIVERIKKMHGAGLLITLDHAEKVPHKVINPFVGDFLKKLSFELISAEAENPLLLRLRAAGRYGGRHWVAESEPVIIKLMMLSPFQFKYIEESVKYSLPNQKMHDLYAAYLMHASAGHPNCMAEGIKKIGGTDGDISIHFSNFRSATNDLVKNAAKEIKRSMRQDFAEFAPLVEKLCVFPVLDRNLLSLIIKNNYIETDLDQFDLEEKLLLSNYYELDDGNCLYDHIARRVLIAEIRASDFAAYKEQCQKALGFYRQNIGNQEKHVEKMFLAVLELELILASTEERGVEKECFFGPEGILERCKQLLDVKAITEQKNILADLSNFLKHIERAWEFRLLLIFSMRTHMLDPKLFEDFVSAIDNWKQALSGKTLEEGAP